MGFTKKLCKYIGFLVGTLAIICCIRTFVLLNTQQISLPKCHEHENEGYIDANSMRWDRFADSLRIRTISYSKHTYEREELARLVKFIIQAHPMIFASKLVEHEIINNYSLLIRVAGSNENLTPYLLAGHLDVVPVVKEEWSVDPFGAIEEGGYLYGRGTMDDKGSVMAQLSALEFLLERGIKPERSFYLAFGHDEEVLGSDGAGEIVKYLRAKGVSKLHFVLDEGMVILRDLVPGMKQDCASIGVTEKGFVSLNISVNSPGGHSSMPPRETAIGILSKAISRLEENPVPGKMDDVMTEYFQSMAKGARFPLNIIFSNLWLFKPPLTWFASRDRVMQGVVRTTTAVTIVQGGMKANVIPSSAWAIVNHRIHPTDNVEQIIHYNRKIIADDRVKMEIVSYREPHPVSPYDRTTSIPYQLIADTVEQIYDNVVVAPATLVATTDTGHYLPFTNHIYRFLPIVLPPSEINRYHGKDERISKENFEKMMNFYYHIMRNADRTQLRTLVDFKKEL